MIRIKNYIIVRYTPSKTNKITKTIFHYHRYNSSFGIICYNNSYNSLLINWIIIQKRFNMDYSLLSSSKEMEGEDDHSQTMSIIDPINDTNMNSITIQEPIGANMIPGSGTTIYPVPFAEKIVGRYKRKLGDYFHLQNFGINYTTLQPGSISALSHYHNKQDEFIYVLQGSITLILDIIILSNNNDDSTATNNNNPIRKEFILNAGDCYGFPCRENSNDGNIIIAHQCMNQSNDTIATYLEIGDRTPGDIVIYPNDDLHAYHNHSSISTINNNTTITTATTSATTTNSSNSNQWIFTHKDGTPY